MVVAVGNEFFEIKSELEKRGFKIVDWNTYTEAIDALIYSGGCGIPSGVFSFENVDMNNQIGDQREFFMLNADNMTVDEISQALLSRLYKPLF